MNLRKNGKFYIEIKRNLENQTDKKKSVLIEEEQKPDLGNSMNETQKDDLEAERVSLINPIQPHNIQPSINVDAFLGSPMVDRSPREMISPAPPFKKQNTIGESRFGEFSESRKKENAAGDGEPENFQYNLIDKKDLEEIRWLLQEHPRGKVECDIGLPFNTNILKIALNSKETIVAELIAHKYKCIIYQDMIIKAIRSDQISFIFQVY